MTHTHKTDSPSPVNSKSPGLRYFHIFEKGFDEKQFVLWVEQAGGLPGERMWRLLEVRILM